MFKKSQLIALISISALLAPLFANAQIIVDPKFDPGLILSDEEALNTSAMSLQEIQDFLQNNNSYLAAYTTYNAHNTDNKSAAQIIFDAATHNYNCDGVTLSDNPNEAEKAAKCQAMTTVNPKFLLVLLQKEQGLIENSNPSQSSLDWATGYGCPDGWACNPYYQGFGKQINSAALQFRYYIDNLNKYSFKNGGTYTMANPYGPNPTITFTIKSKATAALYNYTPHIFNGNYNFYKIWQRYFPGGDIYYPSGSLIKATSSDAVYLIDGSQKRPFANRGALISRFDEKKIIIVGQNVIDHYATGTPLKFPNYSLIKTPDKKIYLLVDDKYRLIVSTAVFKKIGFSTDEILVAKTDDLKAYTKGADITATSTYAYGALVQDSKSKQIYYLSENQKAPIVDPILLKTKFKGRKIIAKTTAELKKYKTIDPILFGDGELLISPSADTVYLIDKGLKRPFADRDILLALGYNPENIISVSPQLLYLYDRGATISLTLNNATSTNPIQ